MVHLGDLASSPPDRWGDIPTWIAGVGTLGAVVVALWIARRDGIRRERDNRRQQAELITGWLGDYTHAADGTQRLQTVVIQNGSQQLAYKVIASYVPTRGGGVPPNFREISKGKVGAYDFRAYVGELPPGRTERTIPWPGHETGLRWALELVFRDAAGRKWLRAIDGQLSEIRQEPLDYYGLYEPVDW
jgi:hypothetical protein